MTEVSSIQSSALPVSLSRTNTAMFDSEKFQSTKNSPRSRLVAMPAEIKSHINYYLSQIELHHLALSSSALFEAAAIRLYQCPRFSSTYRIAQFVTTVLHSEFYASLVRELKLHHSKFTLNKARSLAGWREWKYRSVQLYAGKPPKAGLDVYTSQVYSHPKSNSRLDDSSMDVPLGALIHLSAACKNLKSVYFACVVYSSADHR